jgi:hypothetical protein
MPKFAATIWVIALCSAPALSQSITQLSSWDALKDLRENTRVSVALRDAKYAEGRFRSWSPDAIDISDGRGVQAIRVENVRRIQVQQKASRWKGALIGALVGLGVGFPIGASAAGYLTDRNNPTLGHRAGMGLAMGTFGAGIGAPIGALAGGTKRVTVYESKGRR